MLKKALALAGVLLVAVGGVAAEAQTYPPEDESVTVSGGEHPGSPVSAAARTFRAGTTVTVELRRSGDVLTMTATADSNGYASMSSTIPSTFAPGQYSVRAIGTKPVGNGTKAFWGADHTITAASPTVQGQSISSTGYSDTESSSNPMGRLALVVAAGAGLLMLLGNRRRSSSIVERDSAGV